MIDAPLALAFTAGMVATVNPCGFAMLPAYLAWFVGVDGAGATSPAPARLGRALSVSGLVSLTFIVVFGVVGVLVTAGALLVIDVVPWVAMAVGVGLAVAGVAMLGGWKPIVTLPQRSGGVRARGSKGVVLFGVSYAIASLSCTLPVFLAVVAGTVTTTDLASGVATFVAYGLGMSLVLVSVTVAVASTRGTLVKRMRRASRHVDRVSAVILIAAGAYIAFYWAFTLAVPAGTTNAGLWSRLAEGPVELVEQASTWSVNQLEQWALPISLLLGGLVLAAIWIVAGRGSADENPDRVDDDQDREEPAPSATSKP